VERIVTKILTALRQDHRNMGQLLAVVERQLERFDRSETPDYDILLGVLDYCLTYPDLYHHPKEDLVYARLQQLNPDAAKSVGNLQAEHIALAKVTHRFSTALHSILQDLEVPRETLDRAIREFVETYRRHIGLEESVFFPAAEAHLTEADWDALEAEATAQRDPLFDDKNEARYAAIRADILAWANEDA
jgi:hemerythrin-like domain-containing protein